MIFIGFLHQWFTEFINDIKDINIYMQVNVLFLIHISVITFKYSIYDIDFFTDCTWCFLFHLLIHLLNL